MMEPVVHICGYRRGDGSVCQDAIEFKVHYVVDGNRIRTRSCIKHVGKRVDRAVRCAGADTVSVHAWQPYQPEANPNG